jgi:hypothetical protein
MSDPNRLNLLAVVGTGRSGSTLVDMLIGDTPDVFAGGELRAIWHRCYFKRQTGLRAAVLADRRARVLNGSSAASSGRK